MQNYDTKTGRNDISTGNGMASGMKSSGGNAGQITQGTGTNGRQSKIEGFGSGSSKGLGSMPCNSGPKDPKSSVEGFSGDVKPGKI